MLENFTRSAAAYQRATEIQPFNTLAFKGLLVLAERKKSVPEFISATGGIIKCFQQTNEMSKAVEALEHAKRLTRKYSSEVNDMAILNFQLPGSPIFEYMEGRLPQPTATYSKLIAICEKSQNKALSKYQSRNMARLSSKDSKATADAIYEIYAKSKVTIYILPL